MGQITGLREREKLCKSLRININPLHVCINKCRGFFLSNFYDDDDLLLFVIKYLFLIKLNHLSNGKSITIITNGI